MKAPNKQRDIMRNALLATIIVAAALFAFGLSFAVTQARYVTEIGGGGMDFETETPFEVGSQQDLFNAIKSGYGYVQLKEDLKGPIIMTGTSLDLINDLVIDLNGNEIERNNRESLLNVPTGTTFTVIDSRGGGGMYNPIGSVLTVTGGELNVYGGMFESGPRPAEYFSILKDSYEGSALIDVGDTFDLTADGGISAASKKRPRLAIRESGMGNIYFDVEYASSESVLAIDRDTYCYVIIQGETSDDFATFDTSKATFSYTYYVDGNGIPTDNTSASDSKQVIIFGYDRDIASSVEQTDASGNVILPAPNYSAVAMHDGILNVDVTESNSGRGTLTGSFYSYFGTWQTSCIYVEGGVMRVSTSGEIATVNPNDLPALVAGETRSNSAKYGESACILSVAKTDASGNPLGSGGTLEIRRLASATSYNGSVISLSGGSITMLDATITKNATISHGDDPFAVMEESGSGVTGSEFPADRQYRDAAIFLNGGSLLLQGSDSREKSKSVNVIVNKDINNEKARAAGQKAQIYPVDQIGTTVNIKSGSSVTPTPVPYKTTFGILSRGKSKLNASEFVAKNLAVTMHGAYSYGIFGTRGQVSITDGSVTLDSDSHCYGVYAVNRTEAVDADGKSRAVNVELVNTEVMLGELTGSPTYEGAFPDEDMWLDEQGNALGKISPTGTVLRAASCGVYLDSSSYAGGRVTLDNSKVHSRELGVAVYGGTLTFKNGGGIDAYNASAVSLRNGNILFEDNSAEDAAPSEYEINCYINRKGKESGTGCSVNATTADLLGAHQYEIYLPYQRGSSSGGNRDIYTNENGIRVVGGSLTAQGKLIVNFRGLYNNYSQYSGSGTYTNYDKVVIKSFAIACIDETVDKDAESNANINIKYADITSTVGGGVKVQGGTVTLGDENTARNDINVHTTGYAHLDTAYNAYSGGNVGTKTWMFFPNLGGGHAVIARSGNMYIYDGNYIADSCNGIAATNDDDAKQKTSITIYDGNFEGNMKHVSHSDGADYQTSGPSSFYGLKVLGESEVKIYGGSFDGYNGGAIVRGKSSASKAVVKIYAGIFGAPETSVQTQGQDGFNVYDYSTVYFGAYTDAELNAKGYTTNTSRKNLVQVYANLFPIACNPLIATGQNNDVQVYIYYGKYYIRNDVQRFSIGAVNYGMQKVNFFIFGYGTNVYAQTRGTASDREWKVSRIRWNNGGVSGTFYYAGLNYGGYTWDNTASFNVYRRVTTEKVYYNDAEPSMPTNNVLVEHVADVP